MSKSKIEVLVDRFLLWPLPQSVCSDLCVTDQKYTDRIGTNLLTAIEAKQMFEYVLQGEVFATKISEDEIRSIAQALLIKPVLGLIESDPHQFSTRPCATCRAVSTIAGFSFGCIKKQENKNV